MKGVKDKGSGRFITNLFGDENLLEEVMRSELLWDSTNGRTLCVPCHRKTDSYLNPKARNYV